MRGCQSLPFVLCYRIPPRYPALTSGMREQGSVDDHVCVTYLRSATETMPQKADRLLRNAGSSTQLWASPRRPTGARRPSRSLPATEPSNPKDLRGHAAFREVNCMKSTI